MPWSDFCTKCRKEVPSLSTADEHTLRALAYYLHDAGVLFRNLASFVPTESECRVVPGGGGELVSKREGGKKNGDVDTAVDMALSDWNARFAEASAADTAVEDEGIFA